MYDNDDRVQAGCMCVRADRCDISHDVTLHRTHQHHSFCAPFAARDNPYARDTVPVPGTGTGTRTSVCPLPKDLSSHFGKCSIINSHEESNKRTKPEAERREASRSGIFEPNPIHEHERKTISFIHKTLKISLEQFHIPST